MAKETIGSSIPGYVAVQIQNRESVFNSYVDKEMLTTRLQVMNTSTGWARLSSGVNRLSDVPTPAPVLDTPTYQEFAQKIMQLDGYYNPQKAKQLYEQVYEQKDQNLPSNSDLASVFVLSSGTNRVGSQPPRRGIKYTNGISYEKAYNTTDSLGIRPMAGITSVQISSKNTYGTLQQADISFNVWSREELDICELIYFRPGYTALLEWGHTSFVDNTSPKKAQSSQTYSYENVQGQFFSPENSKNVESFIERNREKTGGNYDAIFGFITNFSWKFRPDGGYDCTLRMVSKGIVLESLKVNAASFGYKQEGESVQEKQRSIFHRIFYILENTKQPETKSGKEILLNSSDADRKTKEVVRKLLDFPQLTTQGTFIKEEGGKSRRVSYLPLRTFLELVNHTLLLKAGGVPTKMENIVSIRAKEGSDFLTFSEHFSVNPLVALPPSPPSGKDPISDFAAKGLHPLMKLYAEGNGGSTDIMNIMVSTEFLRGEIEKTVSAPSTEPHTVYDMLTSVMKGIQDALGGINNFEVLYQETSHTERGYAAEYVITDRNYINIEDIQNIPEIKISGIGTTVMDLQAESKISSEISSQVAIAAQGSTGNYQENLEALLRWNMGAIDRHFPIKRTMQEVEEDKDPENKHLYETLKELWGKYNTVISGEGEENPSLKKWFKNLISQGLGIGSSEEVGWQDISKAGGEELVNLYRKRLSLDGHTPPSPIPVELTLKMLGVAGFKVGTLFRVSGNLFPSSYRHFGFLITGIEHSVESSQKWSTTIKTQYYPLPNVPGAKQKMNTPLYERDSTPSLSNQPKIQSDTPNANRLRQWILANGRGRVEEMNGTAITRDKYGRIEDITASMADSAIEVLRTLIPVLETRNMGIVITSGKRSGNWASSHHNRGNALDFSLTNPAAGNIAAVETSLQKSILAARRGEIYPLRYLNEYWQDSQHGNRCFHISVGGVKEGLTNLETAKRLRKTGQI